MGAERRAAFWALIVVVAAVLPGCSAPGAPAPESVRTVVAEPQPSLVAAARPLRLEMRAPGQAPYLLSDVHPEPLLRSGPNGNILDPADELPAWWAESGVPGSATQQTVVVVGHNFVEREAPFHALRSAQVGDEILLETEAGVLAYSVQQVGRLPKGTLLGQHELREHVPGRLILANCDVRAGQATDDNYFVVAQLSG